MARTNVRALNCNNHYYMVDYTSTDVHMQYRYVKKRSFKPDQLVAHNIMVINKKQYTKSLRH